MNGFRGTLFNGKGSLFDRLLTLDGTAAAPAMTFAAEMTLGIRRVSAGIIGIDGGKLQLSSLLGFVGFTNSDPALKKEGVTLSVRLGDDSGYTHIRADRVKLNSGSFLDDAGDGIIRLSNAAATNFTQLLFGGTSNSFPSLKRTGTTLEVRTADDASYTHLRVDRLKLNYGSFLDDSSDGEIRLSNSAGTGFSRLQFGGSTNAFPALTRNATAFEATLANGSGYTGFASLYERYGAGSPEGVVTAPVGAIFHRTDGGAATTLYVKESGAGNVGWVAK